MTSTLSVPAEVQLRTADDFLIRVSQNWDLAYGTPYFANDSGRIIFDERFIEKEEA